MTNRLLDGLFDNYNEQQFIELQGQYNTLAEWMKATYPEVDFRVDWHLNRIKGYLEVTEKVNLITREYELFLEQLTGNANLREMAARINQ